MTKQDAKNELGEVNYWRAIAALRARQLKEARLDIGGGAIEYDRVKVMGGSPDGDEVQRSAMRIIDAEQKLEDALKQLQEAKKRVTERINLSIEKPLQKSILVMRYIENIDFMRIPEFIERSSDRDEYSYQTIYNEHSNALKKYCDFFNNL